MATYAIVRQAASSTKSRSETWSRARSSESRARREGVAGRSRSSSTAPRSPPSAGALAKVAVTGEVLEHIKGPKIRIHKFKNKSGTTSGRDTVSS